jgi:hypothetical protein
VTTGDKSAQQTSLPRAAKRATPNTSSTSGAKEVRGTAAKGTVKKRAPRAATPKREADVLERLNQMDVAPADQTLAPMPIPLPAIIEADPSFPVPSPSPADIAKASVIDQPAPPPPPAAPARGSDAPTEAMSSAVSPSAVSTESPTELIVPPPLLLAPDVVPDLMPERTDSVPLIAPAPTEAMPATVIGDDVDGSFGLVLPQRALQRPIAFRRGKPRVRRVTRVVRHVDPWSVFKVALVFNTIVFIVCLTSGVLLWNVANATGTVDNVEKFFEQFGWSSFQFNGGALYHNAWIAGLFGALFLTGMAVFLATVFNLITDLVGGIRVSVLEEEVIARSVTYPGARGIGRLFDRSIDTTADVPNGEADQLG